MKKFIILCFTLAFLFSCKKKEEQTNSIPAVAVDHEVHQEMDASIVKANAEPITTLALSESQFDFKEVKKGTQVEHSFEITNTGTNPLIISEVKPTCGCTAPHFTKDPILPNKKGTITLRFDSSNFDGIQHKQAEVYANVEKKPIIISFIANVIK